MKKIIKIVFTNWINVSVVFIVVYFIGFLSAMIYDKFTINEALFGTTYSIIGYGMLFWIGFILSLVIFDSILFGFDKNPNQTTIILVIEWFLISLPFMYWFIKYNEWIFLVAIFAFLLGQYLRRPYILKILE